MIYQINNEKQILDMINEIFFKFNNIQFIYLNGDLGAGKTTFTKYLAKYLGETKKITSPTFNIMQVYDSLIHIDAYNIQGDLEEFEDYFDNKIVVIEWADNLNLDYENALNILIKFGENNSRIFEINEVK